MQLLYKYSLPVFPVLRKWNERNVSGGGRKGDGLRCEGVGGGRRQRSVATTSFNKHNNNNFLKQLKTKTATTIEISRQHLKISDNKIRER